MTVRVVWHEDPAVRQAVDWLGRAGLILTCGPFGLRAQTVGYDRTEELVGALLMAGFRPRLGTPAAAEGAPVRGRRRPRLR